MQIKLFFKKRLSNEFIKYQNQLIILNLVFSLVQRQRIAQKVIKKVRHFETIIFNSVVIKTLIRH